jgi:hypothetical protein
MRLSRYFGLLVAVVVLVGLASCSLPTTNGGGSTGSTTVNVTKAASTLWVAAQDGSGAWQALSGTSFAVAASTGKYGVAWVCPASGTNPVSVRVLQSTVSESTSVTAFCPSASTSSGGSSGSTTYTVSGTLSGVPSGDYVTLLLSNGNGINGTGSAFGGSYTFNAAPGTYWLLAYEVDGSGNPGNLVLIHDISVTGNVNVNIDMSSGQTFSKGTESLVGAANYSLTGMDLEFGVPGEGTTSFPFFPPGTYPVLPAAQLQSGDRYGFSGYANTSVTHQQVFVDTSTPGSGISLQLPAIVPVDVDLQVSGGTGTADWGSLSFGTGGATTYVAALKPISGAAWYAFVTPGWLKKAWTTSSTTYTLPDLTATSGWDSAWDFVTNQTATVVLGGLHGNVTASQLNQAYPVLSSYGLSADSLPDGTTVSLTTRSLTGTY